MNKKYLVVLILAILAAYLTAMGYIAIHEELHRIIYSSYGIGSTTYSNYPKLQGSTISNPEDGSKITDIVKVSQLNNDMLGYYTALIIFTLWMICFIYILSKIFYKPNE